MSITVGERATTKVSRAASNAHQGEGIVTPGDVIIWVVVAVVCGFLGRSIGKSKGRGTEGWWLGFVLGFIGLIIVACLPRDKETEIREAQRRLEVQAEAARRAGVAWPPQPPDDLPPWPQQ
jgi:uncharacterized membrane protein YeaQ/YmgE (transglycosylase-associated protein family)